MRFRINITKVRYKLQQKLILDEMGKRQGIPSVEASLKLHVHGRWRWSTPLELTTQQCGTYEASIYIAIIYFVYARPGP
jgi:hypothetical protein